LPLLNCQVLIGIRVASLGLKDDVGDLTDMFQQQSISEWMVGFGVDFELMCVDRSNAAEYLSVTWSS
jgi:hypothetical protein